MLQWTTLFGRKRVNTEGRYSHGPKCKVHSTRERGFSRQYINDRDWLPEVHVDLRSKLRQCKTEEADFRHHWSKISERSILIISSNWHYRLESPHLPLHTRISSRTVQKCIYQIYSHDQSYDVGRSEHATNEGFHHRKLNEKRHPDSQRSDCWLAIN